MTTIDYTRGLHELGDGCFAWLEPDGSWGWSNAGLIAGEGASLLVDTLFDVPLTRNMLEGMTTVTGTKPIQTVVNTHANGDHWYGNQLLSGREIIASSAASTEMPEVLPDRLEGLRQLPGGVGDFAREIFGPFDWTNFEATYPNRTFDGRLDVNVGGVDIQLIEVGPAHTAGDSIAYVPSAKTVFTGDILFIGGTPIIWAGPLSNWVAACDLMLDLDVDTVVPGHGPVTDRSGIIQVRDYLTFVDREARDRFEAGMGPDEAAADIDLGNFGEWNETSRLIQNVLSVYYELDPELPRRDVLDIFKSMATMEGYKD